MRPFIWIVLLLLAFANGALPARAQENHLAISYVRIPTTSPIVARMNIRLPGDGGSMISVSSVCVEFHNADPRTATAVRFTFVFFDESGRRRSSQVFTRTGTFGTGAVESEGRANCINGHLPAGQQVTIAYYVDSVDFADGSTWVADGLTIPDFVIPGSLVPAPPPLSPPAPGGELAPEVLGRYSNCASAIAVTPNAVRSVFVNVRPGAPIGDGIFHIGAVSVCSASDNANRDAAAVAFVTAMPAAIVRAGAMRLFFPAIPGAPACSAPARLMNRQLLTGPGEGPAARAPDGEYLGLAHVTVRADGFPAGVQITRRTNQPEYDDNLRLSALASRYWPAIAAGVPTAGTYDFAMRWVVVEPKNGVPGTIRSFGPAQKPWPDECLGQGPDAVVTS